MQTMMIFQKKKGEKNHALSGTTHNSPKQADAPSDHMGLLTRLHVEPDKQETN